MFIATTLVSDSSRIFAVPLIMNDRFSRLRVMHMLASSLSFSQHPPPSFLLTEGAHHNCPSAMSLVTGIRTTPSWSKHFHLITVKIPSAIQMEGPLSDNFFFYKPTTTRAEAVFV